VSRVVLFHHALGLTPGVHALADRFRAAGHVVDTPDLFDGRTFDALPDGVAHAEEIGFGVLIERSAAVADRLTGPDDEAVYAGLSLGVLPAQMLAQTRPAAAGALLLHACVPVSEFGDAWPAQVPVQIHAMAADPFFVDDGDIDAARVLVDSAPSAELFLYPGNDHLFADSSLPSFDAEATDLLVDRALRLLAQGGRRPA